MLDEPTNHLDFESILWLESLLKEFHGSLVFITHDRRFLDHIATRIVELDRGKLLSFPGNFSAYKTAKTNCWQMKPSKMPNSTNFWHRKKSGYARESKRGEARRRQGTKAGSLASHPRVQKRTSGTGSHGCVVR